jgi:hypothetical protein
MLYSSSSSLGSTYGFVWQRSRRVEFNNQDICRKPYFVTAGDVIGYIIIENGADVTGDDFQTEDDRQYRAALMVSDDGPRRRVTKETSFKCNVDF